MAKVQKITPYLWYDGQAEAAARFYVSVFPNAKLGDVSPMMTTFELEGLGFMALNGGPLYTFTEAISLFVRCSGQEEVDYYWNKLTADGGEASQCGWLKDKFGLSWQIIPDTLMELMGDPDPAKSGRVVQAMLQMKKIIVADLVKAHAGG